MWKSRFGMHFYSETHTHRQAGRKTVANGPPPPDGSWVDQHFLAREIPNSTTPRDTHLTFGPSFPDALAKRACRALLERTSREEMCWIHLSSSHSFVTRVGRECCLNQKKRSKKKKKCRYEKYQKHIQKGLRPVGRAF